MIECECKDWLARQDAGLPGRCDKHTAMMQKIREAYDRPGEALARAIYEASDGFGPAPDPDEFQWDWSGIRDSSPEAVEAMYEVATRG